jgi:thioredoxin 2
MPETAAEIETLVVACPADGTLNRVPREKLNQDPKCGRCRKPLFEGKPVQLTAASFDAHAAKSELPLVIDFWAQWCGPCHQMAPQFEAAAALIEPRARLGKLNTETEQAIAARYAIRGIPTLVLVDKGREVARTSGAMPSAAIVQWVEKALAPV